MFLQIMKEAKPRSCSRSEIQLIAIVIILAASYILLLLLQGQLLLLYEQVIIDQRVEEGGETIIVAAIQYSTIFSTIITPMQCNHIVWIKSLKVIVIIAKGDVNSNPTRLLNRRRIRVRVRVWIGMWCRWWSWYLKLKVWDGVRVWTFKIQGFVCSWINSLAYEFLAQVGVPVVLDLVIGSPWDPSSYQRPPT